MDKIEELRKQYYESIRLLQNEQDIFNALPQPEYENFFPLIRGIIKMLEDELKENVIIGKIIPAGTGAKEYMDIGYTLEQEFYDEEPSEVLEDEFME